MKTVESRGTKAIEVFVDETMLRYKGLTSIVLRRVGDKEIDIITCEQQDIPALIDAIASEAGLKVTVE